MKFLHVAWDFDGTLYNSYPHIVYCLSRALETFGVTDSQERIAHYAHITLGHAFRFYAPLCGCSPEEVSAAYREQTKALGLSPHMAPYEGIGELLRDICLAGGKNHLCSNRRLEECRQYLQRDGLEQYFDVLSCIGAREGLKSKPDPDLVSFILEEGKVSPDTMVMVGDRNLDHEAAHQVGVKGVFFDPDGFSEVSCDPEFIAPDISALRAILLD